MSETLMKKSKILVIDDEPIIHDIVSFMVNTRGHQIISASNGEEGLAFARNNHPDLILLDIMMPGMQGHDVCLRLKSDKDTKRIPIIMLTGEGDREAVLRARESGANDYIVKPFTLTTLTERVDKFLGKVEVKKATYSWWQKIIRKLTKRY
jgi:DNA-binding response OmpR family regulator